MKRIFFLSPLFLALLLTISCCNNKKNEVSASVMKSDDGNLAICFTNNLDEDVIVDYELSFLADNNGETSRSAINSSVLLKAKEHKDVSTEQLFDSVFNSDIRIWVTKGEAVINGIADNEDVENNIFNKFSYKILCDQNNNIAYYVKNKTGNKIVVSLAEITDTISIVDNDLEVIQPINDSIFLEPYEEKVFSTSLVFDKDDFTKITLGYKIVE